MPLFLIFNNSTIWHHIKLFNKSAPSPYFGLGIVPHLWTDAIINCITQYICILGVHQMSAASSALSLTMVLTLRKFISLLISIFWFQNTFTLGHWLGTALVFYGSAMYTHTSYTVTAPKRTPTKRRARRQSSASSTPSTPSKASIATGLKSAPRSVRKRPSKEETS